VRRGQRDQALAPWGSSRPAADTGRSQAGVRSRVGSGHSPSPWVTYTVPGIPVPDTPWTTWALGRHRRFPGAPASQRSCVHAKLPWPHRCDPEGGLVRTGADPSSQRGLTARPGTDQDDLAGQKARLGTTKFVVLVIGVS